MCEGVQSILASIGNILTCFVIIGVIGLIDRWLTKGGKDDEIQ